MKILFCKVASMKYYKGVCDKDQPFNGGSFVKKTGTCMEDRNFWPVETDDGIYCFGFVEMKTTSKNRASMIFDYQKTVCCIVGVAWGRNHPGILLHRDKFSDPKRVFFCAKR